MYEIFHCVSAIRSLDFVPSDEQLRGVRCHRRVLSDDRVTNDRKNKQQKLD